MAGRAFLQSVRLPERRYEIVSFNKETKEVTLKNPKGEVFTYPNFSKTTAEANGYRLETEPA